MHFHFVWDGLPEVRNWVTPLRMLLRMFVPRQEVRRHQQMGALALALELVLLHMFAPRQGVRRHQQMGAPALALATELVLLRFLVPRP